MCYLLRVRGAVVVVRSFEMHVCAALVGLMVWAAAAGVPIARADPVYLGWAGGGIAQYAADYPPPEDDLDCGAGTRPSPQFGPAAIVIVTTPGLESAALPGIFVPSSCISIAAISFVPGECFWTIGGGVVGTLQCMRPPSCPGALPRTLTVVVETTLDPALFHGSVIFTTQECSSDGANSPWDVRTILSAPLPWRFAPAVVPSPPSCVDCLIPQCEDDCSSAGRKDPARAAHLKDYETPW